MRNKKVVLLGMAAAGLALFLAASLVRVRAQQPASAGVTIDNDDLGGVVTSSKGPEAGVWVIAETTDLPTKLRKIVVTDDQGRYVVPDLPKANYKIWARGYGLVDSKPVETAPGKMVNLTATPAPDARAAAQYYPPNYWFSLVNLPAKSEFPGTGASGNGIAEGIKNQGMWIDQMKTNNCQSCHQIGDKATREIPAALGKFDLTTAAWERRIQSGQDGGPMSNGLNRIGKPRALKMFADWTDRVKAGELPPAPPRPQGVERNVVVTEWDWAEPTEYFHDEVSSDRRNPSVNANGLIYGVHENGSDFISVVDPVHNTKKQIKLPVRDANTPFSTPRTVLQPSPYWGDEVIWNSKANAHSVVMDGKGRLWMASVIRPPENPGFCKGSSNASAKAFPLETGNRQLAMYDPKTEKFDLIDLCYGTHHLQFAEDANNTLWFCGGVQVVGWFNTKKWDETHDAEKSQGWTALVLDTNGNGKRDDYVEPDQAIDPTKDKRLKVNYYGVVSSPVDGSVWGTVLGFPGSIVRLNPGSNPPQTALAEIYELPYGNAKAKVWGYGPRGLDIDRNGVVWTVLSSGHLASFDRRKCKVTNGPTATGQQCPDGWSLYPTPGPNFKGLTDSGSADTNYYNWVDQFDTLGLGKNTPISIGNDSDSLAALMPDGKFMVMRVPYPMGFFSKSVDGRIDDPKAGWKGKGLWSTFSTRTPWHMEGGRGTTSKAVHFQIRPNPLAS